MTWFKVDDGFTEHPKLEAVLDDPALYAETIALWLAAGCYCARRLTDGRVPKSALRGLVPYPTERAASALVTAGLWLEDERAYHFHDWQDYQPTKAQVIANREATAERVRKYRGVSNGAGNGVTSGVTNAVTNEPETPLVTRLPSRPDPVPIPSRPIPSRPVPAARAECIKGNQAVGREEGTEQRALDPQPTPFAQVEEAFGAFRKRVTGKTWKRGLKDYAKIESIAERLTTQAADEGVPLTEAIADSLAGLEADQRAREAGFPLGWWESDPTRKPGPPQLTDAQRQALQDDLDEAMSRLRYESNHERQKPHLERIRQLRVKLGIVPDYGPARPLPTERLDPPKAPPGSRRVERDPVEIGAMVASIAAQIGGGRGK